MKENVTNRWIYRKQQNDEFKPNCNKITLNVNGLITPIKKADCYITLKSKTQLHTVYKK